MKFWHLAVLGTALMALCFVHREARLKYQVGNQVAVNDGSWNYKFVTALGNSAPSPEILMFMTAWQRSEGGHAEFNPLNTTMPMAGDSCYNYLNGTCGVRNYQSEQDGFDANIATITNGRYGTLLGAIQTNDVNRAIDGLRQSPWGTDADTVSAVLATMPVPVPEQTRTVLQGTTTEQRRALVEYALSLRGAPYTVGGGSAAFRAGELDRGSGDCSSTMQHIYMHVLGLDIGTSTFTQFTRGFHSPSTVRILQSELQPGDLWYGSYSDDEHVAMYVGDVTGDGTGDFIDQGGKKSYMDVDNDAFNDPYFMDHTVGYARMIEE